MRYHPASAIIFVSGLLVAPFGHAANDLQQDLEWLQRLRDAMEVDADSVEYLEAERKVVAKGGVRIGLEDRSLFADEVAVDLDDQTLVATGHVLLMEGLNRLEGDRIEYNYRTNLGVVRNGRAFLAPGVSFSGVEIRRESERQYRLIQGRFTTCRLCQPEPQSPDWEFRAQDATVYQDDWIVSRNTSFWVRGIPALYSPIAAVPIGPRRTGFLVPRFGYGNRDGFVVKQPFFWALSPSQDATVTLAYRAKRGFDFLGEYRYILAEDSRGELSGRYLHDNLSTAPQQNRAEFKWLHSQLLAPTWTFKADVRVQSDRALTRDFVDSSVADRTQRTLPSKGFVTQATPQYMLLGLVDVTRDLSDVAETRTSRLPEVRFQWLPGQLLETPLVAEGETSVVYLERNQGEDAGRFDFHSGLRLPVALGPWLAASSLVAFRETAYTGTERSSGSSNRTLVELGERLASRFARRFDEPGLSLLRLTHVVEPAVTYQYVPWTDQQSLPQFDPTDFISAQNRLTYQLTNRLIARWREAGGEIRSHEVATLEIAQSWNLQSKTREFSDAYLTSLTPERVDQAVTDVRSLGTGFSQARERELSNLVFSAGLSPLPGVAFRGTLALNTEDRRTDAINTGVQLRLPDLLTLEIGSTYVRDQLAHGLVAKIEMHVTKTVLLDFLTRYDAHTETFLENAAGLRYTSCCWELGIKYTNRTRGPGQPVENDVRVTFDLKIPTPAAAR
ncbi:MAG: LPS-assembly protein LptD [candidate division NC10 bacterium]|nr:LPS-assembly protein LptD [candidate division NC10 bacterium]